MGVPLTIRCDCGATTEAVLGESVTCECGRRYDTSGIPAGDYADVRRMAARQRLYVRLGITLAIAIGLVTWYVFGVKGPMLSVPLAALAWWRLVLPRFQRGQQELLHSTPVIKLDPSEPG